MAVNSLNVTDCSRASVDQHKTSQRLFSHLCAKGRWVISEILWSQASVTETQYEVRGVVFPVMVGGSICSLLGGFKWSETLTLLGWARNF